jgi:hypothetical protein
MQHPIRPSQWLLEDVEEQNNAGANASQQSPRFVTSQRSRAGSVSQEVTGLSNQGLGLHPGLAFGPDNIHEPGTWQNAIGTRQNASGTVLVQPSTGASFRADAPAISTDLRDEIPAEPVSGFHFADPHELSLQEREVWTQGWLAYPPSANQPPLCVLFPVFSSLPLSLSPVF